jgi:hypothetical protein
MFQALLMRGAGCVLLATLAACGGGSGASSTATDDSAASGTALSAGSSSGAPIASTPTSSSSSGSSSGTNGSSTSSSGSSSSSGAAGSSTSSSGVSTASVAVAGPAAKLVAKLQRPSHLLVGLGAQANINTKSAIESQNLKPDIYEAYLTGVGGGDWTTWISPAGEYVLALAADAKSMGAIPMFVLYQMMPSDVSPNGGTLASSNLQNTTFMTNYWNNVRLMYQMIARYGEPVLVNLEPDFFGYAQQQVLGTGQDGGKIFAYVNDNADCASQPNDVIGIAGCLVQMARKYAPNALIAFPPTDWGANGNVPAVIAFNNELNAGSADFIILQTLDGDAGCYELKAYQCNRSGTGWYWDETNTTTPNFNQFFAKVNQYQQGIGNGQLPVLIWQNPEGVPSSTPGGTQYHFRDNRENYFLTHTDQVTASHVFAVTFTGGPNMTSIGTDGGQFQTLSEANLAHPTPLQ